ncbi:MAG: discoidin domain-containing protein [Campylobacterota bacterium]|nr:discoidin domain-containing protein [Campylobacterota bacterium]
MMIFKTIIFLAVIFASLQADECKIGNGKWNMKVGKKATSEIVVYDKVAFFSKKTRKQSIIYIECNKKQKKLLFIKQKNYTNSSNSYYNFAVLSESSKNSFTGSWYDTKGKKGTISLKKTANKKRTTKNLAYKKATKQSSTGHGGQSSRAVDGNKNGNYGNNSVTHTNSELHAWWEVDLGKTAYIQQLKIYNRSDCCKERLNDFDLIISHKKFPPRALTKNEIRKNKHFRYAKAGKTLNIKTETRGRYVRIQLKKQNYLSLAEVEVIGY